MEEAQPTNIDSKDDGISILPESILHHILFFLSQKEATRTCVLSRAWRYVGCTRPKIDFAFVGRADSADSAFDSILQVYHDRNIRLDEFSVRFPTEGKAASLVEKWIPMIIHNMCVKTFHLITTKPKEPQFFQLPSSSIVESDHIQNLSLERCMFQSSPEVRVSLHRLQSLRLINVSIPEEILNSILSNCPFLEGVSLFDCSDFKRIKLFTNNKPTKLARFYFNSKKIGRDVNIEIGDDLPTLTSVKIQSCSPSFNLEKQFESAHRGRLRYARVNLLSANSFLCNFTTLYLFNVYVPEPMLDSILSDKSRFIESVSLFDCKGFKRVKVLSNNLAHFYFRGDNGCESLTNIEIGGDVQNLRTIELYKCMLSVSHNKPLECARLTRLNLTNVQLLSESFSCNLHSLEELKLDQCSGIEEFNLSSRSMKRLSIKKISTPFKATIDAPSIVSFNYEGILRKSISFATTSSSDGLWKSEINLESSSSDRKPSHCFNAVYGLLKTISQSEISLSLDQIEIRRLWRQLGIGNVNNIVGLSEAKQPPLAVEHLRIMSSEKNNMYSSADPFLIRLFHMFRPSFLYMGTDMLTNTNNEHRDIVELLFKERETEYSYIWQRVLEGVSLHALYRNQSEWQPVEYTKFTELCEEGPVKELELRIHLKWRD